jgi:hypothetical protein
MCWRELRHGFDRQLSVAQQSVDQLLGCVACQHPRAQASRHGRRGCGQLRSAVEPGREHASKEAAIEAGIAGEPRG